MMKNIIAKIEEMKYKRTMINSLKKMVKQGDTVAIKHIDKYMYKYQGLIMSKNKAIKDHHVDILNDIVGECYLLRAQ